MSDAEGEVLLTAPVPAGQVPIRLFVDDLDEPDRVVLLVMDTTAA